MAVARFPGSLFAQFVWPLFGAASVVGIGLSIMLRHFSSSNRRLAIVLWLQGVGVLAAWLVPGIAGLLLGGLLVGGGFLCAVQLSLYMAGNWRLSIRATWQGCSPRAMLLDNSLAP